MPPAPTTVNTSRSKGAAIIKLLVEEQRSLREESIDRSKGSIFFFASETDTAELVAGMKRGHRLGRIPGFHHLSRKVPFARMMNNTDIPIEGWPKTWVVPDQPVPDSAFKRGPLIYKPDDGAQGDGIEIIMSARDLATKLMNKPHPAVVQRYITKPLLLDGLKFDLRVYVLVLGVAPARAMVCMEGLARVCCSEYSAPTRTTKHKTGTHLTNYSLSKYDHNFVHTDDPADGSIGTKRTMSSVLDHVGRTTDHSRTALWGSVTALCGGVARRMAETVINGGGKGLERREVLAAFEDKRHQIEPWKLQSCFHLLGVDVILDADGQAHLLEVNALPSWGIDSVFPVEGPHQVPPPVATPERDAVVGNAKSYLRNALGQAKGKHCKCMAHHRPHEHHPCAVDIVAKKSAMAGALRMLRTCRAAEKKGSPTVPSAELVLGTEYEPLF